MSASNEHGKIITKAAREILRPLGIRQKGRSRTWLDDRGWWVGVIEFQPSSWGRGSYLNVGACFLWYFKDYLSFDYGDRESPFVDFTGNEDEFPEQMSRLAGHAAEKALEYRKLFADYLAAAEVLCHSAADDVGWPAFDAAVACALVGRMSEARRLFGQILNFPNQLDFETDWEVTVKPRCAQLLGMLSDTAAFRREIEETIARTRVALKLS
jgi:hypothetical protein